MSRETKDSGIVWIGNIPSEWNVLRIKNTSWLKGRIGWDGLKSEEFQDEGPYLITGTDFADGKVNWSTCVHISEERFAEDELLHIFEGDLLITKDGTIGKLAMVKGCPEKVSLNSGVMIIRNNTAWKYDQKYMYYILGSDIFTQWFEAEQKPGSTIKHLYQHQFSEFRFPFPPLPEQHAIVAYLDKKCAAIDEAIERHKKIIEKLETFRHYIISHVVMHGLTNAEEKAFGSFDTCPKHWGVSRLKFVADVVRGGSPRPIENYITDGEGYNWVKISDATGNGKYITATKQKITEAGLSKTRLVHPGTLLLTNSMSFGHPYVLNIDGCIHDGWLAFSNYKGIDQDYLYYFLMSESAMIQFVRTVEGSVVNNLNIEKVKNSLIAIPPLPEQKEIVRYLEKQNKMMDEAVIAKNAIMKKLEEYRKSIIYNAVTGKIDCRKEAV